MHAASTNQIAEIFHLNDNLYEMTNASKKKEKRNTKYSKKLNIFLE